MGGAVSIPTTSQSTKSILEFILRELFRRADLVDLYSLADPARCKAYIVASGDALNKVFATQMITPKSGKGGIIYFQRVQAIQGNPEIKRDHDENCKKLAFYFIRIFQIYGALALSVLDTEIPQTDLVPLPKQLKSARGQVGIAPPAVQGFQQPKRSTGFFGSLFSGGALSERDRSRVSFYIRDGPFKILNKYLTAPRENDSNAPLTFDRMPNLYINQLDLYTYTTPDTPSTRQLIPELNELNVNYTDDSYDRDITYSGKLKIQSVDEGRQFKINLSDFRKDDAPIVKENMSVTFVYSSSRQTYFEQNTRQELALFLKSSLLPEVKLTKPIQFLNKYRYIQDISLANQKVRGTELYIVTPRNQLDSDKIKVYYRRSSRIVKGEASIFFEISISKAGDTDYTFTLDFSSASMDGSNPTLKTLIENDDKIRGRKTETFVATRDEEPISKVKQETFPKYIERIFKELYTRLEKYAEEYKSTGVQYTRDGIVKPYDSSTMPDQLKIKSLWDALARKPPVKAHCVARALQLLSVAGIRSDSSLGPIYTDACKSKFLLEVDHSLPTTGSSITSSYGIAALNNLFFDAIGLAPMISDNPTYKAKIIAMRKAFEGTETEATSMTDIKSEKCSGKERINLDVTRASQLRKVVNNLLARQKRHVSAVVVLLGKLFDMPQIKKGVFYMNPRVISGGMDEVNKIGEEARNLLLTYYEGCETDFKSGLTMINVDAAALAAPDPAAADDPTDLNNNNNNNNNSNDPRRLR